MSSDKATVPEEEASATQCPVCLETWDTEERLPKFLMCHHSICVTCAGEMQRTAKKRAKPNAGDISGRGRGSRESLDSLDNVLEEEGLPATWIRCPMCRTRTFIEDPAMLQTNFYLSGLTQSVASVSTPRLVLWCETCSIVATPECGDHIIRPVGEKMRELQDDLVRRADVVQGGIIESLKAHECHMEVYRWLCGMLRHAHSKVLAALTHAAQYHQALQQHTEALQTLVQRGDKLQFTDNPEEVIEELTKLLKELDAQQSDVNAEVELPILKDTFQILRTHQGPHGYSKALVVMDANKSVTLSLYGELERQEQSCTSDDDTEELSDDVGITLMRAMSLQASRRKKKKGNDNRTTDDRSASFTQVPVVIHEEELVKNDIRVRPVNETNSDPPKESKDEKDTIEQTNIPETTVSSSTHSSEPLESQTLQRNGDFGRGTVNMSNKKYPSHLCYEEPITDPATVAFDNESRDHQGDSPASEAVPVNGGNPGDLVSSVPQENNDDNDNIFIEDHGHPPNRNNRRKRRQNAPSEDGDRYPPQRSRRQSSQRRRNTSRKPKKAMCSIM